MNGVFSPVSLREITFHTHAERNLGLSIVIVAESL